MLVLLSTGSGWVEVSEFERGAAFEFRVSADANPEALESLLGDAQGRGEDGDRDADASPGGA